GIQLAAEGNGYYSTLMAELKAGTRYRFRLDDNPTLLPDPASRFQPEGPSGPSQVIDPDAFVWSDKDWGGLRPWGNVGYEMHIGTFTPPGTWGAAAEQLPELARLGVTMLEIMPIADFPGQFGWGYDGVNLFAPTRLYGAPDDFRGFVNAAHQAGVGVLLDVVYNHLGPHDNTLPAWSPYYLTDKYENEWGDAINFDGENSGPVREYFLSNARYWLREFHLDGLRIDATQAFFDNSNDHILRALAREVRSTAGNRSVVIIGESEPQRAELMRPFDSGGFGMDMLWNDDFHHSAIVAVTGRQEAYFTDYNGAPQEFISATKYGYLFQGQRYKWQKHARGSPAWGLPRWAFMVYLQNHDQVPNAGAGRRLQYFTSPGRYRAITALLLLGPNTPLLFQGEEFASTSPFHYFADHAGELAEKVRNGRKEFLTQFRSTATVEMQERIADPGARETFEMCKLDFSERDAHQEIYRLHLDLLRLRHKDAVISRLGDDGFDGAVLGPECFVLRYFSPGRQDRLLIVNLGKDLHLDSAPEPLLAPFEGLQWVLLWSSEHPDYGGSGTPDVVTEENWEIPGHSAVLLKPSLPEEVPHE
ncbi:MAG TPA: malto-oligosyltrehalose trehalohydrolase, partial [Bacteroidota bacterium]